MKENPSMNLRKRLTRVGVTAALAVGTVLASPAAPAQAFHNETAYNACQSSRPLRVSNDGGPFIRIERCYNSRSTRYGYQDVDLVEVPRDACIRYRYTGSGNRVGSTKFGPGTIRLPDDNIIFEVSYVTTDSLGNRFCLITPNGVLLNS